MQKRLIAVFLVFIMILGTMPVTFAQETSPFKDIKGHWAEQLLIKKYNQGLIAGYPDGTYHPNGTLTTAELVTVINRSFGLSRLEANQFEDVKGREWFRDEADKAYYYHYIERSELKGNVPATRMDAVSMVGSLLDLEVDLKTGAFKDLDGLSKEQTQMLEMFAEMGYLKGDGDGTAQPNRTLSRAEVLMLTDNILGYVVYTQADVANIPSTGSVTIIGAGITIENKTIENLYISPGITGKTTIKNTTIKNKLEIASEGNVVLNHTSVKKLEVRPKAKDSTVNLENGTKITTLTTENKGTIQGDQKSTIDDVKFVLTYREDMEKDSFIQTESTNIYRGDEDIDEDWEDFNSTLEKDGAMVQFKASTGVVDVILDVDTSKMEDGYFTVVAKQEGKDDTTYYYKRNDSIVLPSETTLPSNPIVLSDITISTVENLLINSTLTPAFLSEKTEYNVFLIWDSCYQLDQYNLPKYCENQACVANVIASSGAIVSLYPISLDGDTFTITAKEDGKISTNYTFTLESLFQYEEKGDEVTLIGLHKNFEEILKNSLNGNLTISTKVTDIAKGVFTGITGIKRVETEYDTLKEKYRLNDTWFDSGLPYDFMPSDLGGFSISPSEHDEFKTFISLYYDEETSYFNLYNREVSDIEMRLVADLFNPVACNVKILILPRKLKTLNENVGLAGKKTLEQLVIPAGVETIENGTFSGCTNLKKIVIEGDPYRFNKQWEAIGFLSELKTLDPGL